MATRNPSEEAADVSARAEATAMVAEGPGGRARRLEDLAAKLRAARGDVLPGPWPTTSLRWRMEAPSGRGGPVARKRYAGGVAPAPVVAMANVTAWRRGLDLLCPGGCAAHSVLLQKHRVGLARLSGCQAQTKAGRLGIAVGANGGPAGGHGAERRPGYLRPPPVLLARVGGGPSPDRRGPGCGEPAPSARSCGRVAVASVCFCRPGAASGTKAPPSFGGWAMPWLSAQGKDDINGLSRERL